GQEALGATALERELLDNLPPPVPGLADHPVTGDDHVGQDDLVEVVLAEPGDDRADRDPGSAHVPHELGQPLVAATAVAGAGQQVQVRGVMGVAGPDLAAGYH